MSHPIEKMIVDPPLTLDVMQQHVYAINKTNGWFDEDRDFAADVALLHSEVSEMFEAFRDHGLDDVTEHSCTQPFHDPGSIAHGSHVCKPEGVGSEVADVFIRLLDTCQRRGIDLEAEFRRKLAYNRTRDYRHGGKRV